MESLALIFFKALPITSIRRARSLSHTAKIRQLHFTNQVILKIYPLIHRLYRLFSNIRAQECHLNSLL